MELTGLKAKLYQVSEFIMMIAYLNILWIIFTLFGGIVLGIHPATVALFSCIKQWRETDHSKVTFSNFKEVFKSEFKKANILGGFITVLVFLGVFNGAFIIANRALLHPLLTIIYFIGMFFLVVLLIYIYPVYVYFGKSVITTIVYSVTIGMAHPIVTTITIIFVALLSIAFFSTPGLPMFFGISAAAYVVMKYTVKIFDDLKFKALQEISTVE